ncbi:glycosyltransferase [Flammeovirga kamogawensis]|uniref:Glycosyltransferase n=1 Tax=Flammeovirga kamogawensis TaxID=373891 RepID=A0ABX8GS69_9BACT|nr:glycosyltransferase [Flammeovirga kamogawensis]MBB6461529.1 glycosyltransferase involved in cell wall biosynthesis [Flammeovirga kamogawensis]QWG06420.1 glycosyltransferase [Flammeovirga kamogawensis]TRX68249.1 glycosyltransferase family 4 protein [Flammeovirga kamogawensis]
MKIAYVLPINIERYTGVLYKVKSQVTEWKKQGNDVKIFLITSSNKDISHTPLSDLKNDIEIINIMSLLGGALELFLDFLGLSINYKNLDKKIDGFGPDIIYARNSIYQPFLNGLSKKWKVVFEVNTDMKAEYSLQKYDSLKYYFRYIYFILTNQFLLNKVSGIASVTYDIAKSLNHNNIKVFPNSINIYENSLNEFLHSEIEQNRIFFIGTDKMIWHGIDILLKLAERMPNFNFDIVGSSRPDSINIPSNVQFYGFLNKEEYKKVLAKATVTIASLAFFRNNMEEACPLKVREYMSFCKPIILPYKDTCFINQDIPEWILELPNNKEGILESTDKIKDFVYKCRNLIISQSEVEKFVHVSEIEKNRLAFFHEIKD